MASDASPMRDPKPGDANISSAYLRKTRELANRQTHGPGVISGPDGVAILTSLSAGGTNIIPCVMRELVVETPICTMQEVEYDAASKLTGEDDFPFHVVAIGTIFEVLPPPTFTYAQFNVEGALRDPDDADDPENLSAAILWWVDTSRTVPWAWMMMKSTENLTNIVPT